MNKSPIAVWRELEGSRVGPNAPLFVADSRHCPLVGPLEPLVLLLMTVCSDSLGGQHFTVEVTR